MPSTTVKFSPLLLLMPGIIITYLCSMVAAGHGVIFVGLLLITGWEHWLIPVLIGWIGIASLAGGMLFGITNLLCRFGVIAICFSWVIFLWNSEILMNLLTSIPFLICLVCWFKYSVFRLQHR